MHLLKSVTSLFKVEKKALTFGFLKSVLICIHKLTTFVVEEANFWFIYVSMFVNKL